MTTSMVSSIEAYNQFKRNAGFTGVLFSDELQLQLGSGYSHPNQRAELALKAVPQRVLEYDEIVDIKILLFTINDNVDVQDIEAHPEDYEALTLLYKRVYG